MDKNINIVVAGGRNFNDYKYLKETLNKIVNFLKEKDYNIKFISGKCRGADKLGENFAKENNISIDFYPADWKDLNVKNVFIKKGKYGEYNALAGFNRNEQMAKKGDLIVVYWDGKSSGSKDMIDLGRKYKKKVKIFKY